jgi:hypothetical protein
MSVPRMFVSLSLELLQRIKRSKLLGYVRCTDKPPQADVSAFMRRRGDTSAPQELAHAPPELDGNPFVEVEKRRRREAKAQAREQAFAVR